MARAIIRYSIDAEQQNLTGNAVRKALQEGGFDKIGTASYEADGLPQSELLLTLGRILELLGNPPGRGRLDHLWIYLDEPEPEEPG